MVKKDIRITIEEYDSMPDLGQADMNLMELAESSLKDAYAVYSHYRVGAALILSNGKVITGNNQENAAYPSGLCAERVAMFYAKSQYPGESIEAIAISAKADTFTIKDAVAPCGACRQVMAEYEIQQKSPIRVVMKGETGPVLAVDSIEALLPLMFHAEELKRKK
ncbi:MAG: cytidine deaminase [Bacteroidetes bacterium]|nr:MAG: cytidine deaminase [Bacteroidota bacterium]RLD81271.1 MAG: cytidine deaminase [Bacteroidota bacterium]